MTKGVFPFSFVDSYPAEEYSATSRAQDSDIDGSERRQDETSPECK